MGPRPGFLPGSIQRLHGHTMLELTPGMRPTGALPAWARGGRTRLAGIRVAAGTGLARLSGKLWLRNVAAARGARRASGGRNTMAIKREAGEAVRAAKARLGVTWAQLAEAVGRPAAWTTSALLGQQPMTAAQATAAGSLQRKVERLGISDKHVRLRAALSDQSIEVLKEEVELHSE